MAAKKDYYEILGINRDAGADAIKKAYRKLAKKYHPDSNKGNADAEQKFKEISGAYSVLSDPEKKKLYDQFGHAAFDPNSMNGYGTQDSDDFFRSHFGGARHASGGTYKEYHFEDGNMDDFFSDIFGDILHGQKQGQHNKQNYGSGFHRFYSSSGSPFEDGSSAAFHQKGTDLETDVSVTFDEAAFGCDKIITLKNPQTGASQSLQVHIPAGIESGKSVRLRGKGNPGIGNGPPGDLLLHISVGQKPGYERKGMDVYTSVEIPFTTAVFGGEALVSTLYGNVLCKIRPGTACGTKIKLKGKGIASMKTPSVRGDQYVTVQIQVPRNLTREEEEKLREFERLCQKNGHDGGKGGKSAA